MEEYEFKQLVGKLEAKSSGDGNYTCKCVVHNDKTPSLSIKLLNGKLLVKCFAGCEGVDIINEFKKLGYITGTTASKNNPQTANNKPRFCGGLSEIDRIARAKSIWVESEEQSGTITAYLRYRGISDISGENIPKTLRYNKKHNAIVGMLINLLSKEFTAVELIYINENGKARKDKQGLNKRTIGVAKGTVFPVKKPVDKIILVEGIEDALATHYSLLLDEKLNEYCVCATCGTSGLKGFTPPSSIKEVIIFSDNDSAGRTASSKLVERLKHNYPNIIIKTTYSLSCKDANELYANSTLSQVEKDTLDVFAGGTIS